MILRRFGEALKSQDWTVVLIEFVLVVTGVLVALEVDRYNEGQKKKAYELELLLALERDIERDIDKLSNVSAGYQSIKRFGSNAYATLNADGCTGDSCWTSILEFFHASQWLESSVSEATFEEMKRSGLPSSARLKEAIEEYYDIAKAQLDVTGEIPPYRELVRSMIPPDVQNYIWKNCFSVSGTDETYDMSCVSPITETTARQIIQSLQQTSAVKPALTFWMSTLSIHDLTIPIHLKQAEQILLDIQNVVDSQF